MQFSIKYYTADFNHIPYTLGPYYTRLMCCAASCAESCRDHIYGAASCAAAAHVLTPEAIVVCLCLLSW